ncbi:hypothetical protein QX776_07020 [Alteromonadaceae bacterium BrNp21-10]|nr:hypothetical protein [Alteromonadaceae bacterium BrNp21-10]
MAIVNDSESRSSPYYRALMGTALAMISFGQFNDTKELLSGIYQDITTHFTHQIQYDQLGHLTIGRTISYVEGFFGPPEVIKISKQLPEVQFQYYNIDKAVITIMNHNGRVGGFVVIPIANDFDPLMPYVGKKLHQTLLANQEYSEPEYYFDSYNLTYFAGTQNLGKPYMFLQWVTGFVEYGGLQRSLNTNTLDQQISIRNIAKVNELFIADQQQEVANTILDLQQSEIANFYAYTELDSALVAESLLTRFEFNTYFGAHDGD